MKELLGHRVYASLMFGETLLSIIEALPPSASLATLLEGLRRKLVYTIDIGEFVILFRGRQGVWRYCHFLHERKPYRSSWQTLDRLTAQQLERAYSQGVVPQRAHTLRIFDCTWLGRLAQAPNSLLLPMKQLGYVLLLPPSGLSYNSAEQDFLGRLSTYLGVALMHIESNEELNDLSDSLRTEVGLRKQAEASLNRSLSETEDRLRLMTHTDPLTGLLNRAGLLAGFEQALAQGEAGQRWYLLLIDVDRFKYINDVLGDEAGNACLQALSANIRGLFDSQALVARFGDDEFSVLTPLSTEQQGPDAENEYLRKIHAGLARTLRIAGNAVTVSSSIGGALYPEQGACFSELLRRADVALWFAKEGGRDCVRRFDDTMLVALQERASLSADLAYAIERGQLEVYLQPILRAGQLDKYEVLLRWHHPEMGFVPPDKFIPIAEKNGLIVPIGKWVITEACRIIAEHRQADFVLALNVSPVQIHLGNIIEDILDAQAAYGIPLDRLEVELTESCLVSEVEKVILLLETLRGMGIKVAIDDFGTGYSSLAYLVRLPINILKIDKSFISNLPEARESQTVVASIIELAHRLSMQVVAEGVETEAQEKMLNDWGCDMCQGYRYSRPFPASELQASPHVSG